MVVRNILGIGATLLIVASGYFLWTNQQDVVDWWYLRNYQPSAEIAQLAEASGMGDQGEKYFFVSDPKLNDKQTFRQSCPFGEKTIVLGCYDGRNIYILDIEDPKLEGVETVTAAHEMLHAAYERLSEDEKERIDQLLNEQFAQVTNQRILDLVAEYDTNDQALINNELHSILPTELEELSSELEEYYQQLFDDRQLVVAAAKKYEAVFIAVEDEIDGLESQLANYKSDIEFLEAQLAELQVEIDTERQTLNNLEDSRSFEEYNSRIPGFNVLVKEYNELVAQIRTSVEAHNSIVNQINELAVRQNELVNTINSNYQEL
jgi:uncharacterized coiled-coil protein SlyX